MSASFSGTAAVNAKASARLVLGLVLAVALDTAVQLLWKTGVSGATALQPAWQSTWQSTWQTALALLRQPLLLAVAALMAGQYLNWMTVLARADLSYAHSFTSLSYVTVALGSALLLGERLDPVQLLGVGFILAGVWFVGASGRRPRRARAEQA